jgi:hypothetical protein
MTALEGIDTVEPATGGAKMRCGAGFGAGSSGKYMESDNGQIVILG